MPQRGYALEDEDDDPDEVVTMTSPLPTVAPPNRGWEYRAEVVSVTEIVDASGMADRLNRASQDGWDLVQITSAGADRKLLVLRRPRPEHREHRPVGFAPHQRSG